VGEEGMIEVKCPFYFKRDGSGRIHKQVLPHYYQILLPRVGHRQGQARAAE